MDLELLGWARVMVKELYQYRRLTLQTSLLLRSLQGRQQKEFWNYLYPLQDLVDVEHRNKIPVSHIERLAQDPRKLKLLSAGVGFVGDLSTVDFGIGVLRAAALGGSVEVVELNLPHMPWFYSPGQDLSDWATKGGHLELVRRGLELYFDSNPEILLKLAAKYGQPKVAEFLLTTFSPFQQAVLEDALMLCFPQRDPALAQLLRDALPQKDQHYCRLAISCLQIYHQNPQVLSLFLVDSMDGFLLGLVLVEAAKRQTVALMAMLLELGTGREGFADYFQEALETASSLGNVAVQELLLEKQK